MTKTKSEQREEIYKILKRNDATNKASWWNIASEIVDEWLLKEIKATDLKWKKRVEEARKISYKKGYKEAKFISSVENSSVY